MLCHVRESNIFFIPSYLFICCAKCTYDKTVYNIFTKVSLILTIGWHARTAECPLVERIIRTSRHTTSKITETTTCCARNYQLTTNYLQRNGCRPVDHTRGVMKVTRTNDVTYLHVSKESRTCESRGELQLYSSHWRPVTFRYINKPISSRSSYMLYDVLSAVSRLQPRINVSEALSHDAARVVQQLQYSDASCNERLRLLPVGDTHSTCSRQAGSQDAQQECVQVSAIHADTQKGRGPCQIRTTDPRIYNPQSHSLSDNIKHVPIVRREQCVR